MRIDECARVYYMCEYVCCHATRRFFFLRRTCSSNAKVKQASSSGSCQHAIGMHCAAIWNTMLQPVKKPWLADDWLAKSLFTCID